MLITSFARPGRPGLWRRRLAVACALAAAACPARAGQFDSLFRRAPSARPAATAESLRTPPVRRSVNGELRLTLEARRTPVTLGPYAIEGATYDGSYGGPVLRVRPGDVLRLTLVNRLPQATNIHFHGLQVSPRGHGDNAMHLLAPGESWEYVIPIPRDHPPGVYWFHTHAHAFAERQLMGGLSGTLVIEGFQDEIPATRPLEERLLALKEFAPDRGGRLAKVPKPFNFVVKTINGQLTPRIDIRPGETQLWRLSDQTANTYFRLSLEGHSFTVIGRDSHPLVRPETAEEIMLGPGQRMDVLVTAGRAGSYRLIAGKTSTGPAGDMFSGQDMAVMVSAADPSRPPPEPLGSLTVASRSLKPIPADRIDERRLVSFSEDPVTGLFFVNHATFDHERVDLRVPLGNVEEWTVRNASDELHIFHLHQTAFQVISENGRALPFEGLVDTVNVPIHGEVKIRIAFTDPVIVGRFMFHCHILEHEDKGMMGQIEVYDPKAGPMPEGQDHAHSHEGTGHP